LGHRLPSVRLLPSLQLEAPCWTLTVMLSATILLIAGESEDKSPGWNSNR
jgi:hypothetical protein